MGQQHRIFSKTSLFFIISSFHYKSHSVTPFFLFFSSHLTKNYYNKKRIKIKKQSFKLVKQQTDQHHSNPPSYTIESNPLKTLFLIKPPTTQHSLIQHHQVTTSIHTMPSPKTPHKAQQIHNNISPLLNPATPDNTSYNTIRSKRQLEQPLNEAEE